MTFFKCHPVPVFQTSSGVGIKLIFSQEVHDESDVNYPKAKEAWTIHVALMEDVYD